MKDNFKEKNQTDFTSRIGNSFLGGIVKEIRSIPFRGIKNMSYLTAGNFVVQIITVIGFIYIARLLGAKNYGIYLTVTTFVRLFDLLLLRGINKSVMREGSRDLDNMHAQLEKVIGLRNTLIAGAMIVCVISSLFVPYDSKTRLYILLFSTDLIYLGLEGFLETIFQASEKMKYISLLGIFNRLLFVGLSILSLLMGFGLAAIFLIALFSNFMTLFLSFHTSKKIVKFNLFMKIHIDKKILIPGLIFSLNSFLNFLGTRADILMISWLGTPKDVGVYGVAFRIAEQGVLIKDMAMTAFFPFFIKRFQSGKVKGSRLIRISLFLFVALFLAAGLASLFVEDLVPLLFGAQYEASGYILKVLIFYVAFSWAGLPFTTAVQATYNEKFLLITSGIFGVLNIVLNYVFFQIFGLIGIAYSTLVVRFFGTIAVSALGYKIMKLRGHLA